MKHLTILVPDGHNNLSSMVGSWKIFTRANQYWVKQGREPVFEVQLAGLSEAVELYDGLFTIKPHTAALKIKHTDLIIIPSLNHCFEETMALNQELADWIKWQYNQGAAVASICTGAFLLAATGLLDGKTCSTNWAVKDAFISMFPEVTLLPDRLITDEHNIYTNGGAFSFLNLIIYLIEKYYDRPTAIYCAKVFQIDIGRSSQSPFIIFTGQKDHDDEAVKKAQDMMEANPGERIAIGKLATQVAVSRRNFDRRFIKATGNTPLEYWQRVKIEVAKKAFENTVKTISEVMYEVGYSDEKAFREIFRKITGLSPLDYRGRYHKNVMAG
ncbi:helix-turn-helix domain-containing protein [Chitinophaga agrisoli]|uniref:Helix-turn-helix domain-containing protein n=1 Tax=Chitinophaga agrisoli TaxID=2607653 RepID=A0A5B2W3V5_9BACT|nr:helix-turn-helix domain-containing protein [Chitinophaga agrisoli]KAA2245380.1 helix-turn-helix domain-containing protein [Chitinophaga agrisoli]